VGATHGYFLVTADAVPKPPLKKNLIRWGYTRTVLLVIVFFYRTIINYSTAFTMQRDAKAYAVTAA